MEWKNAKGAQEVSEQGWTFDCIKANSKIMALIRCLQGGEAIIHDMF